MSNMSTKIWRSTAALVLLVTAVALLPEPADAANSGSATASIDERYLTVRPQVGPTWVVNLAGMSPGERMLLRTLQGQVNRSEARLYLVDPGNPGTQRILDSYVSRGLVTIAGTTDLSGALDEFASEVAGFEVADESEPWTFGVGATIAATEDGIVVTPDLIATAQAHGLAMLGDLRGRWTDATTAYTDTLSAYRSSLDYPGIAVLEPGNTSWDFAIQQRMPVVFTRPSRPDWSDIASLITASTPGHPIYGYLSDTEAEENQAITTLASADLVLVPTATTQNLSYHIAVGADRPLAKAPAPNLDDVAQCRADQLNVVVGLTDGDNLRVPLSEYQRPDNWPSANRGKLPIGWSIGPQLSVLAPAVWNSYAEQATPNDELVGMIGYAYTAPALLEDPRPFYDDSFELMDTIGMSTFWSLGGGLETPSSLNWADVDAASEQAGTPTGVLVGYGSGTGVGSAYWSPGGLPAFTSGTAYTDWPADLVSQVEALLAMAPSDRPLVSFLSATTWANTVDTLTRDLLPFEDQGVRFLTPAQAAACMPPAPAGPTEVGPSQCLPTDTPTQSGLSLITNVAAGNIGDVPTTVEPTVSVTATPSVPSGGLIDYRAQISLDLDALAERVLEDRARPIVAAGGYGDAVTQSTWVEMAFSYLTLRFALPDGAQATGTPAVQGPASAAWSADGRDLEVDVGSVSVDSRNPGSTVDVTVDFTASATPQTTPTVIDLMPGPMTFDMGLTVGVLLVTTPLTGTVTAPWSCVAASGVLASTTVMATAETTSTTTPPHTTVEPPTTTSNVPTSTTMPGTETSVPGTATTTTSPAHTTVEPPTTTSDVPTSTTAPPTPQAASTAPVARPVVAHPRFTG